MEAKAAASSAADVAATEQGRAQAQAQRARADFDNRSLLDRKAALNLVQFAQVNDDIDLGADSIETLLDMLIVSPNLPASVAPSCR